MLMSLPDETTAPPLVVSSAAGATPLPEKFDTLPITSLPESPPVPSNVPRPPPKFWPMASPLPAPVGAVENSFTLPDGLFDAVGADGKSVFQKLWIMRVKSTVAPAPEFWPVGLEPRNGHGEGRGEPEDWVIPLAAFDKATPILPPPPEAPLVPPFAVPPDRA